MARLDNLRRIMTEDFPKDDRKTIGLLAEILNSFMGEVIDVVNGNVNFDNLTQEIIKFKIFVDANGDIITEGGTSTTKQLKLKRNTKVIGVTTIKSSNITDSSNFPTANPYISFSTTNQIMTINKIKGLQADEEYELSILIIYED